MDIELRFLDRFFAKALLEKEGLYTEERALSIAKLIQLSRQGHLCANVDELGDAILSLPFTEIASFPIIKDETRFYLQKNWFYETLILKHIKRLKSLAAPSFFEPHIFSSQLQKAKLLPRQAEAIRSALDSSLTLLCGGPGTGKTYTASQLISLLWASFNPSEKKSFRVCLSAPTGKAAAHFQSILCSKDAADPALQIETSTLHRLLKLQPGENRLFSQKTIDADLVIVDEASMIDVPLLAHLLEAISDRTLLVLMGDPDQLPPVDAGSLFGSIASCFGLSLEKSLRTEDTHLQDFIHSIKEENEEELFRLLRSEHLSLSYLPWGFDAALSERLYREITPILTDEKPDPKQALQKYQRYRVLNTLRQGPFGVDALNSQIFRLLEQKKQKNQWWAVPILVTVNDTRSGLYNGTAGVLIGQTLKDAIAYFPDDSESAIRAFKTPPAYEMAFCLSIHKSQGSEFEEVLALFPEGSENFGKEALYTAVTRSKKALRVVAKEEVLRKMLKCHSRKRSGFIERIRRYELASRELVIEREGRKN